MFLSHSLSFPLSNRDCVQCLLKVEEKEEKEPLDPDRCESCYGAETDELRYVLFISLSCLFI